MDAPEGCARQVTQPPLQASGGDAGVLRTAGGEVTCGWREVPGVGLIWAYQPNEREDAILELWHDGNTLDAIGQKFSLTRERIRQLINKLRRAGVPVGDGGETVTAARKAAAKQAERDERYMLLWGMTYAEYAAHVDEFGSSTTLGSPLDRYTSQRNSARERGIGWEFTFADWWRVWQESGHWHERGRGAGYVMARKGDTGPYRADNIYICTASQNIKDGFIHRPWALRFPNGHPGRRKAA